MKVLEEFRTFAMRGSVVDMAVGIVIGGAFGKIVSSFVSDIIMPPVGLALGGVRVEDLKYAMKPAELDPAGAVVQEAVTLNYGSFLQATADFLIVALAIFMVIKGMNALKKKEPSKPAEPPMPAKEEVLLTEIRDALKAK